MEKLRSNGLRPESTVGQGSVHWEDLRVGLDLSGLGALVFLAPPVICKPFYTGSRLEASNWTVPMACIANDTNPQARVCSLTLGPQSQLDPQRAQSNLGLYTSMNVNHKLNIVAYNLP